MANETSGPVMRFGVAGLGAGATNALGDPGGLSHHPKVKLTAGADPRQVARDHFASTYGAETFQTLEDLCKSPNVDAVYILTPSRMHAEHAIIAAEHGKQIILDKPIALTMEDAEKAVQAADRNGVRLLVGHSQSLDIGIVTMAEMVQSGELGKPIMFHSSFFSDWIYRPRGEDELDPANGDNLVLRQGPVQIDIARMLGGGLARSVRAMTSVIDPARPIEGSYAAYLEFEDGTPAMLEYSGYAHFSSSDLTWEIGLGGRKQEADTYLRSRKQIKDFARPEDEFEYKESTRFGGSRARGRTAGPVEKHQFFGFTLASCEKGDIRQSPDGLIVFGDDERREISLPVQHYAATELNVMYDAWVNDKPLAYHDARWGMATLEVGLGILQSAKERREIPLSHQVKRPAERDAARAR